MELVSTNSSCSDETKERGSPHDLWPVHNIGLVSTDVSFKICKYVVAFVRATQEPAILANGEQCGNRAGQEPALSFPK